ncbi:MAG: hypothetical protein JSV22_06685 [Bacteroidales bacterium]|nr:MAG: hypothetical protein JSV22_06685 [Bacteroidales bacterium]
MRLNIKQYLPFNSIRQLILLTSLFVLMLLSCEYDTIIPIQPPQPKTAEETPNLEVEFVFPLPTTINSTHWNTAKYTIIETEDIAIHQLYKDGKLNMTGTYEGINSFNDGGDPELTLRAAYDSTQIGIFLEWSDSDMDASHESLLWNGDADPRKTDSTAGWTSQRNCDKVTLLFEIPDPDNSVSIDIWQWTLGLSEPLGYLIDKYSDENDSVHFDAGKTMFVRNAVDPNNSRSAPLYEWNGEVQNITKTNGTNTILDPAFYLFEDNILGITGDIEAGNSVYNSSKAKCAECHGEHGEGAAFGGINYPGAMNSFSRTVMDDFLSSEDHTGSTYYNQLNATQVENLITRLRGMSGVPGYYITQPEGSSADIIVSSEISLAKVNRAHTTKYKILIIRDLQTGNPDDIQFTPENKSTYIFDIHLSDNDGVNKIGSLNDTLIFLKQ